MAIRPVDLQQVVVKSLDVTRDTAAQQQAAAAAQQNLAESLKKKALERAETVSEPEEFGAAAVHDRGARSQQQAEDEEAEAEQQDPMEHAPINQQAANKVQAMYRPRVGRHVDVQA